MARKRMIDPTIWEDPEFNSLSRDARLLFISLISNADDEGYLRGDAGSLRRLAFGFDDDLKADYVEKLREEIATKMRSVHIYDNNQTFIHLAKWFIYQKQQKDRIVASVFPKCNTCYPKGKQALRIRGTEATQTLKEVDEVSRLSKKVNNTGKPENKNTRPLARIINEKREKLAPSVSTVIDDPDWKKTTTYYAEKLGFIAGLTPEEMERFLKAGRDAIELHRKTKNFHDAFNYVVDHTQQDPHQRLKLFFKIYENGLQKYG
jgi:hypothetical protein